MTIQLFLCSLLACGLLEAAVIRGSVVEHSSGKPLARARVTVFSLSGAAVGPGTQPTSRTGSFEFQGLPAGAYVVKVERKGFASTEYGQKTWKSAGYPIFLDENGATFLNV